MGIPEHGIMHRHRPPKSYTREQIERKRDRFTVDQCQTQVFLVTKRIAEVRRENPASLVLDMLQGELDLWMDVMRAAMAR